MNRKIALPYTTDELLRLLCRYPRLRCIQNRVWVLEYSPSESVILRDFDIDQPLSHEKVCMTEDGDEFICLSIAVQKYKIQQAKLAEESD